MPLPYDPSRVPTRVLAGYGTLAFPLAAAVLALQVFVPTFYAGALGLSLSTVGLILLAARLWDTVTDPLIGYLSDRTPARLGRRRLWVLLGVPLTCLSVWALFQPPAGVGPGYLLFWTLMIYLGGTMVIVPMNAWGAEISSDYHQRSRISGARVICGIAGTLVALVAPTLLGQGDARDLDGALSTVSLIVLAGFALALLLLCWAVPDRAETRLPDPSLRAAFAVLQRPSPFRKLLLGYLLNGIANALPATLFLLFATHVLQRPDQAGPWMVCYFAAMFCAVPLWVRAAARWGKDRCWRFGMALACLAFATVPLLGPGDEVWFLAIVLASGLAAGSDLVLPSAMQADLVDWDAMKTGYRRPGIYFAVWGTATKLSFALAIGLAFPLLDLVGFDAAAAPGAAVNAGLPLTVLVLLYGVVPIGFKLAALLVLRRYPLTRRAHDRLLRRLAQREAVAVPAE